MGADRDRGDAEALVPIAFLVFLALLVVISFTGGTSMSSGEIFMVAVVLTLVGAGVWWVVDSIRATRYLRRRRRSRGGE